MDRTNNQNHERKTMSYYDASWNELNANPWRRQDLEEQMMANKADDYWVKKHFGSQIKITGRLVFARNADEFLAEIERQNKKLMEEAK
jgi:hypothetical protein